MIKDPTTGLLDFYAWKDDDVVFLCWKYGEDTIRHWHAPRRRLPRPAARRELSRPWIGSSAGAPSPSRSRGSCMLLDEHYGDERLQPRRTESPYELLVATILSAQCTDARVNLVTPALFEACPTPADLDAIPAPKLERLIKSTGFFRNKTKSLKGAARMLVAEMGGEVPRELDQLLRLPGVARKTANVVLGTGYGIASGVVVDTHVGRITQAPRPDPPRRPEEDRAGPRCGSFPARIGSASRTR